MSSVGERIREFDQRQGGGSLEWNGMRYYANGATRDAEPLGPMFEPPTDDLKRLTNIRNFYRAKHVRAVQAFNAHREEISYRGASSEETQARLLKELEGLKTLVGVAEAELEAAEAALMSTPEMVKREQNRRDDEERAAKARAWRQQVMST